MTQTDKRVRHEPRHPWVFVGDLAAAAVVAASASVSEKFPVLGASRVRVRFKADATGTLKIAVLREDAATKANTPAERSVAVAANTESTLTVEDLCGEEFVEVTFTDGGAGSTITYAEVYQSTVPGRADEPTWAVAGTAVDNAQATATRAAEAGRVHYMTSVSAAFSAAVAGKLLEVKDGTAVIYRTYIHDQRDLVFDRPLEGSAGNAVSAELAASGGAGTNGVVSLSGYTV